MNHQINLCLIGAGRAGMIHAMNFQYKILNANISSVVDPSEQAKKDACSKLGIEKSYFDYKEALKDEEIDGVIVVAPSKYHRDIVIDCAKAKKHVFCEKPMALTAKECEDMIIACEENGVILQLGFMRRFDKDFIEAKKAIKSGVIGDVVQIRSLTRGPSKPQEWMFDISISNGPLSEVNSHDIDCIRWLAESEFESLYAIGGNYRNKEIKDKYPDFYDNVILNGKMKNGIQVCIEGSQYVQYGYDARVEILGTKGVLFVGRSDANHIKIVSEKESKVAFVNSWINLFEDAYLNEDEHFANCVIENKTPDITGVDGKMAVSVVEAGNESIRSGRIVNI